MLSSLLLLALAQGPSAPTDDEESLLRRASEAIKNKLETRAGRAASEIAVEPSATREQLHDDREVWCVTLDPSTAAPSGEYRLQCDDDRKRCLASPNHVLHDGVETEESLARVNGCSSVSRSELLKRRDAGYHFVQAVAEAPDGWYRDDQGRVLQVNFDLHRRVYFGGAWAPSFRPDGTIELGRGRADFGIEIDFDREEGRELHRLRLLEGSAWLGADPRIVAVAARYDWSVQRRSAPLWLTTFVGRPRRIDLDINLTAQLEVLRLEMMADKSYLTLGSGSALLDLWHSADLQSYVRLRAGLGAEMDLQTKGVALRPEAAVESDFTLDHDGFHHLTASATGEKLLFEPTLAGRALHPQRLRLKAGYELIVLAINDYPLTLLVDGQAQWRDDLPSLAPGWDFGANVGLRFSFWAPARRTAGPTAASRGKS